MFHVKKRVEGFSTTFRQWRAEDTHCKFLHGYGVYFDIIFKGELDHRNWVADFGLFKRSNNLIDGRTPSDWFKYMFDHTTIIAEDDPYLDTFRGMNEGGLIQLRILPYVGAERFAEYLYRKLNTFMFEETDGKVWVEKVEFYEHEKNMASFE